MSNNYSKLTIISSLIWKLLERGATQGIQFIVQIVLARLLAPEQFGSIAIIMVFINIAQVFVQSGFNTALIQRKEIDNEEISSVFFLSMAISLFIYIILFIFSPSISGFYNDPILIPTLRVLSLTLFLGALNSIQNAVLIRNLEFKKLFKSSLWAVIISGSIGVVLAFLNFGIWSLVVQQLVNQIVISIILWFTVKWRPTFTFSIKKIRSLFVFGSNILVSSLINTLYTEIRTLLIGRIYSPITLGYYNRGEQFPKLIVSNIDGSIQTVMLPTLSAQQDNKDILKKIMRRAIGTSSFFIFPMMIGMIAVAEPLVSLVLTDKWLPAVPFLRIFCLSYALFPIHTANLQAINAIGRSDVFLKLEVIKKILGIIILIITIPLGVYAIAFGQVVSQIFSTFINASPNKKLLNYSYFEQIKDLLPSVLISMIMGGIVYSFNFLISNNVILLFTQLVVGIFSYLMLAIVFKIDTFNYIYKTIKQIIKSKKK